MKKLFAIACMMISTGAVALPPLPEGNIYESMYRYSEKKGRNPKYVPSKNNPLYYFYVDESVTEYLIMMRSVRDEKDKAIKLTKKIILRQAIENRIEYHNHMNNIALEAIEDGSFYEWNEGSLDLFEMFKRQLELYNEILESEYVR